MASKLFRVVCAFKYQRHQGSYFSTAAKNILEQNDSRLVLEPDKRHLRISLPSNPHKDEILQISTMWLRDHCRCSLCYNTTTDQRSADIISIETNCSIMEATTTDASPKINIVWNDGHRSVYDLTWIRDNWLSPRRPPNAKPIMWSGEELKKRGGVPTVSYTELINNKSKTALKRLIENIVVFGVGCISDAPATFEDTCQICEVVALPQETLYGKFWKFSAENMEHADTAYTTHALGAHTDLTYYFQTAGLQVFHLLQHTGGKGGATLLVDGFKVATELKSDDLKAFQFLSTKSIPCHHLDKDAHYRSEEPVISLHPLTGDLKQFRFNIYDRAPLNTFTKEEDVEEFYRAYTKLAKIVRKPENELWVQLDPGTIIFIDNFRVMHGRASFTGKRVMCGCYLQRDSFLNNARILGI